MGFVSSCVLSVGKCSLVECLVSEESRCMIMVRVGNVNQYFLVGERICGLISELNKMVDEVWMYVYFSSY